MKYWTDPKAMKQFWYMISERHEIFLRRFVEGSPSPWTSNAVLAQGKFTNIFRDLDRGTIYLYENLYSNQRQKSIDVLFRTITYRLINRPETFNRIKERMGEWPSVYWTEQKFATLKKVLNNYKEEKNPVFTSAYMVTLGQGEGVQGANKVSSIIDRLFCIAQRLKSEGYNSLLEATTMEAFWEKLQQYPNIGAFIAYEVVTDLTYTNLLKYADDYLKDSWANSGPGCKVGIAHLFSRTKTAKHTVSRVLPDSLFRKHNYSCLVGGSSEENIGIMRWLQDNQTTLAEASEQRPVHPELDIRAIEHSLCEFSKFRRASSGGKLKNVFSYKDMRTRELFGEKIDSDYIHFQNAFSRLEKRIADKKAELRKKAKYHNV